MAQPAEEDDSRLEIGTYALFIPPERLLNRRNSKEWTREEAEYYSAWLMEKKDLRVSDLLAHRKTGMPATGEEVPFLKKIGADGTDRARQAVRQNASQNVDAIRVSADQNLTVPDLAVVEEAHRQHLKVAVHAAGTTSIQTA